MKIALIDASLHPLTRKDLRGSLGVKFRPSHDLMKVYAYCRREHLDVRMLSFREEMERIEGYSTVVVACNVPESKINPVVRLVMEKLGWPDEGGRKTVMESLHDMHEGTDLCVVGENMYPDGRAPSLGGEIEECPADPDAYGEALYLRHKMNAVLPRCKRRIMETTYGRIVDREGVMMPPLKMAMYSGSGYLFLEDEDPAGIPSKVLDDFMLDVQAKGFRVHFFHAIDLPRLDQKAVRALCRPSWYGYIYLSNYDPSQREKILRIADACGPRNIVVFENFCGKDAYSDKAHMDAILHMVESMYDAESIGVRYACDISSNAKRSRFGPLYMFFKHWRGNPRAYFSSTPSWYVKWTFQRMTEEHKPEEAQELMDLYEEACEARPRLRTLSEGYCGKDVQKRAFVYKREARKDA